MESQLDWNNRWQGGFCALGANGGLPVRHRDYAAQQPLAHHLTLPDTIVPSASRAASEALWSTGFGGQPVVMVRNLQRARTVLLQAMGLRRGETVGLPANASRALVETVKQYGAHPCFLPLDTTLRLEPTAAQRVYARCLWLQPAAGLTTPLPDTTLPIVVDHSATLPWIGVRLWEIAAAKKQAHSRTILPIATLYGLHLSTNSEEAGALIAMTDTRFAAAVQVLLTEDDTPDWGRVLAQYRRLSDTGGQLGLAARQQAILAEVAHGLAETAGLPLLPTAAYGALAHGIAIRIPEACEPSTFYAYVRGEQTPINWMPDLQPLHYAALREQGGHRDTAIELARWLVVPVGPGYSQEEIAHAVLGVVKAAEYTGMRWHTDPVRALEYAQMLESSYGPDHDAYRPLFPLHKPSS